MPCTNVSFSCCRSTAAASSASPLLPPPAPQQDQILTPPQTLVGQRFVDLLIKRRDDEEIVKRLRFADHPSRQLFAWPVLQSIGVDISREEACAPFTTIAATVYQSGVKADGNLSFGEALRMSGIGVCENELYENIYLHKVFNCQGVLDACSALRPVLLLKIMNSGAKLGLGRLLDDIFAFGSYDSRRKLFERWAIEYYKSERVDNE